MQRSIVYVSHSRKIPQYRSTFYTPLRKSILAQQFVLILPHEQSDDPYPTRELFEKHATEIIILAEISFDSQGQKIELTWADALHIPVITCARMDAKSSLHHQGITSLIATSWISSPSFSYMMLKKNSYEKNLVFFFLFYSFCSIKKRV